MISLASLMFFLAFFIGCLEASSLRQRESWELCDDLETAETCHTIFCFPNATINSPRCSDPDFAALARKCPSTCDMCNEFGYGCPNVLSDAICEQLAATNNCGSDDHAVLEYMEAKCAHTCGLCLPIGNINNNCTDLMDCTAVEALCSNDSSLVILCPHTCNFCPTGGYKAEMLAAIGQSDSNRCAAPAPATTVAPGDNCTDLANNCLENIVLCTDPYYGPLMSQQCRHTCGWCNISPNCVDQNERCPEFVSNHFCESTNYSLQYKCDTCAKSCHCCT